MKQIDVSEEAIRRECPYCDVDSFALERPLAESDNFRVVCDVHPICEGHCLIIPKAHISCVGQMDTDVYFEFERIYRMVQRFQQDCYGFSNSFEHGVTGQTVFHCHVQMLPFKTDIASIFPEGEDKLRRLDSMAQLREIYEGRGKYLFASIDEGMWAADSILAGPGFFRLRFARAARKPERGPWKEMRQNASVMAEAELEINGLEKKWDEAFGRFTGFATPFKIIKKYPPEQKENPSDILNSIN
jgi:diadenosine tetraphosphate (Ap4A) HIT family hydrolase